MTQDRDLLAHIEELVEEEHRLIDSVAGDPAAQRRLHNVEVQLDQCWDLLRQRRARRHAGQDPDQARARDAPTLGHYQQ